MHTWRWLVLVWLALWPAAAWGQEDREQVFRAPEISVAASPEQAQELPLRAGETVVDTDVWPTGPEAALLLRDSAGRYRVAMWNAGAAELRDALPAPEGLEPRSLTCHPAQRVFFLSGRQGQEFVIVAASEARGRWTPQTIYRSPAEIRRVVVGPRPFQIAITSERTALEYRLFFGRRLANGAFAIDSVTETGKSAYRVVGPKGTFPISEAVYQQPNQILSSWALPSGFHPAGHIFLWENERHCFQQSYYERDNWGKTKPLMEGSLCGGSITATPNGSALIHWRPGTPGVTIYSQHGRRKSQQAADYTFVSTPSSVPDGRGIIGVVRKDGGAALVYVPIEVPLANVVNAWMFLERPGDEEQFANRAGLFRQSRDEQLYGLYDSEAYYCKGYDHATPTRPYLVTTDIFWELLAAAYEGTFIVEERQRAMPAFWDFVESASISLYKQDPNSAWARAFTAVARLRIPAMAARNAESARILAATGRQFSPVLGREINYGELKPRGHYTSAPEMAAYFKAFRYLTLISNPSGPKALDLAALRALPPDVRAKALAWVRAYQGYIAPSRAPLIWSEGAFAPPPYAHHPQGRPTIFPLAWGFDNEVLLSTVYHSDWPAEQQVKGPGGARLLPSGLDVAAALGSAFARSLLEPDIGKYPPLATALDRLARASAEAHGHANLYDSWISALGVQWADDVTFPGVADDKLWKVKRLQTGLASWATLRHATVLVNERNDAECGEGGFELIEMSPPRGYVEPDPRTLETIAGLFDELARAVEASPDYRSGGLPDDETGGKEPLRQGILRRLRETAGKARLFAGMARKELRGEPLADSEYEEILYVGRVAEHHFLIYKSLANKNLALSTPDPMPKIADVAGGGAVPFLEAAVGGPLEWNQVVPYFGRRELVKGSVYSYFEFASPVLLNDAEWRKRLPSQAPPPWVKPYLSPVELSCPARPPF